MNPWKMVGPVVLVALSLVPAPAHAQRRGPSRGVGGSRGGISRSVGSRVVVAAPFRSYSRPYYSFRPRFSVGFGLYVGYPVAFPYYGYGYAYPYPYRYGYGYPSPYPYASYSYQYPYPSPAYTYPSYPPSYPTSANPYPSTAPAYPGATTSAQGSITIGPSSGQQALGGISFSVTPSTAQVYVDGQYVGLVSNFSPTSQPLTLTPGRHHVEVRAVGYQMMAFDTEVTPGEVVPYQGTMQR